MSFWNPYNIYYSPDGDSGGGGPGTKTGSTDKERAKATLDLYEARSKSIEQRKDEIEQEQRLNEVLGLQYEVEKNRISLKEIELEQLANGIKEKKELEQIEAQLQKMQKAGINIDNEEDAALQALIARQKELQYTKKIDEEQQAKSIAQLQHEITVRKENNAIKEKAAGAMGDLVAKHIDLNKWMTLARNPMAALKLGFAGLISMAIKATMEYDKQRAALAAITAGSTQFNQGLADTMNAAAGANLSMQEAGAGFAKMAGGLVDFGSMAKGTRQELSLLSAGFGKFGIDITGNLNIATKAMGMTGKQAGALQRELFATGKALGPHMTKKVMSEFGPAMSTLAAYTNDRAIKVFKGLAAQSQATGVAISELLSVAKQFDTYDSAAESVGRLNSMLGGDYLNSVQMLNASEKDRIKMLQQGIAVSGKSFGSMSRFEKKAVAAAAGITDMSKAMQILGTDSEKLADMEQKAKKAGMSVEQFKAATQATNDVSKQFAILMQNLAIVIKPVIDVITTITGWFAKLASFSKNTTGKIAILTTTIVGLRVAFVGLQAAMGWVGTTGIGKKAGGFLSKALGLGGKGGGAGMMAMVKPMLIFAGVLALIGLGFAAFGAGAMVVGPGLEALAKGITAMGAALATLTFLGALGLIAFLPAFGFAAMTAGMFMLLAAPGFWALGKALGTFSKSLKEISGIDQTVIVRTVQVFDSIGRVSPIAALTAGFALQQFKEAMLTVEASKKEEQTINVVITHNNIQKTGKAFEEAVGKIAAVAGKKAVVKAIKEGQRA